MTTRLEQRLAAPTISGGYKPSVMSSGYVLGRNRPTFTWGQVEEMRIDPGVQFCLDVMAAPISRARWQVRCESREVARFIDGQIRKIWQQDLPKLLAHLEYGACGGETLYECGSYWEVKGLADMVPGDLRPMVHERELVAVKVNNTAEGTSLLPPARFWWVANRPRFGSPWGRSQLASAWVPWWEKHGPKGACDSRRTWYFKNSYSGGTIRHPNGVVDLGDGVTMSNQDYARELLEKFETGGILALPNSRDETGEYEWVYEPPQLNGDASGLLEYPRNLDDEITEGMGVPVEVRRASEVGSGWSGRSVPFLVFLSSMDRTVSAILSAIDKHIIRYLVLVNFGQVKYTVAPISLVPRDQPSSQQPGKSQQPNASPPPVSLSAQHAPTGGVTVQGTHYTGGQFIPSEVMERATTAERAAVEKGGQAKAPPRPAAQPGDLQSLGQALQKEATAEWSTLTGRLGDLQTSMFSGQTDPDASSGQAKSLVQASVRSIHKRIDTYAGRGMAALRQQHGGILDSDQAADARGELANVLDTAKADIADAAEGLVGLFDDVGDLGSDDRQSALIERLAESADDYQYALLSATDDVRDGFTALETSMEEIAESMEADWEEEASTAATSLNQDYEEPAGQDATADAAAVNQDFEASGNLYRVWYDVEAGEWVYGYADDVESWPGKKTDKALSLAFKRQCRKARRRTRKEVSLSAQHAPAGGVTVAGKKFQGGEFIPASVMAKASPEEKAAIVGKGEKKKDKNSEEDRDPEDGDIPQEGIKGHAWRERDKIADFSFGGEQYTVRIDEGLFDFGGTERTVYRWTTRRHGDGKWTLSERDAIRGGRNFALKMEEKDLAKAKDELDEINNDDEDGGEPDGWDGSEEVMPEKLPSPKKWLLGKSKADIRIENVDQASLEEILPLLLGNKGAEEIPSLVGCPDEGVCKITYAGEHRKLFSDDKAIPGAKGVRVTVDHPQLGRVSRFIGIDAAGRKFIQNEILEVKKAYQGSGIGAEIFAKQVENAVENGFAYIGTHAAGGPSPGSMNGYYTWPRFGYNEPLSSIKAYAPGLVKKTLAKFPEAKSVRDVMLSDGGREWWKANGGEMKDARFDLREGSWSRHIMDTYLAERSKAKNG